MRSSSSCFLTRLVSLIWASRFSSSTSFCSFEISASFDLTISWALFRSSNTANSRSLALCAMVELSFSISRFFPAKAVSSSLFFWAAAFSNWLFRRAISASFSPCSFRIAAFLSFVKRTISASFAPNSCSFRLSCDWNNCSFLAADNSCSALKRSLASTMRCAISASNSAFLTWLTMAA